MCLVSASLKHLQSILDAYRNRGIRSVKKDIEKFNIVLVIIFWGVEYDLTIASIRLVMDKTKKSLKPQICGYISETITIYYV